MDGSPSGSDAVVLAALLARATGAELMPIAIHEESPMQGLLPDQLSWSTLQEQARTTLAQTRDELAPEARIAVHADVLVWRGLRHMVRLEHRDLLVVGSKRGPDDGRIHLGKTTSELFWRIEFPLAIAPAGLRHRANLALERIGIGFDGNLEAKAALGLASSLAAAAGARLEVRHVVNDVGPGGVRTEQITLGGDALVQRELADQVDVLVLGAGHRGEPGAVQLGDTSKAVLDQAPCPVVVLPRAATEARDR